MKQIVYNYNTKGGVGVEHRKKVYDPETLVPEIEYIVNCGGVFPLTVTGVSMRPFITPHIDTVFIEKATPTDLKKGDIVFVKCNGRPILHRIYKLNEDGFFMKGDAHVCSDGFFEYKCLIGVARFIHSGRTNKKRKANTMCIRFLVKLNRVRIHIFNFFKR